RTTAQPRARTPGHKRDLFVTTDADDGLHFRGGLGQQNRQRHNAKIGQPVALIGVQLAGFGNQTPANNGAELIEDARFHAVLARELSAWFAPPKRHQAASNAIPRGGLREGKFLRAADKTVYNYSRFSEAKNGDSASKQNRCAKVPTRGPAARHPDDLSHGRNRRPC